MMTRSRITSPGRLVSGPETRSLDPERAVKTGVEKMVPPEKSAVSDRRRFPRFDVDLPIKYTRNRIYFKHGKYGRVVNASEGGLLAHLPEEAEVGQQLSLQVFLASQAEIDILETSVRVIWTNVHVRKDLGWDYQTGLSFVGISADNLTRIKDYLTGRAQRAVYSS